MKETLRVLVVDDNPTNLKLACDVLAMEGCQVMQATDAREARLVIEKCVPDIILMDIELPGMDGLTFTKMLKAGEATRQIAVVALTAFAMKGDHQKAIDAGCVGYISKPFDTRRLGSLVEEYHEKSKRDAAVKNKG